MARAAATREMTGCDVAAAKVLVVGAGGIGCELVKNLVLSGFSKVMMIDLDTIDYSNLNRQFLFRAKHVGRSKAEVAREEVLQFPHDPDIEITSAISNIKSQVYTLEFFSSFSIVLNALDNVDARRHVNRVCLAAGVPLIESGTQGYLGQVYAILKGKSQCYDCNPPPPPKSYPICTIRNHPDKPVHCIAWAKELLFKKLFSGEDTDLVDTAEGEGDGGQAAPAATAAPLKRADGENAAAFAHRVFDTVFLQDVQRLLSMEALWKERTKPTAINLSELKLPDAATLTEVEQRPWSVEENAAVFLESVRYILDERSEEVGALSFDKDDARALDFVAAAANLRASIFGIPRLSRWDIKEIAGRMKELEPRFAPLRTSMAALRAAPTSGNIIPAIATTNAIIAGFIVLEAFKVLAGRADECRYMVCNRLLSGRARDMLLSNTKLDTPNPNCYVCGKSALTLTLDTTMWTVQALIERIVIKHLSFNQPTIDYTTLDGAGDQLCEGVPDSIDEEDALKYERYLPLQITALPVPIVSGTVLDVEDMSQVLSVQIVVKHATLSEEEFPSGFVISGENPGAANKEENRETDTTTGKRGRDKGMTDSDAKKSRADTVHANQSILVDDEAFVLD